MVNAGKTVIRIFWTQGCSVFNFISYPLLVKSVIDLPEILEITKKFSN